MTQTRDVDVCAVAELPEGEAAVVTDVGAGRISVWHAEGAYYGISDTCTHQEAWLSDGFLEGCEVECPLHSAVFDLRTGEPDGSMTSVPVKTYAARAEGDRVVVRVPA